MASVWNDVVAARKQLGNQWTDDTAVINAAIDACKNTGDYEVFLPAFPAQLVLPPQPDFYNARLPGPPYYVVKVAMRKLKEDGREGYAGLVLKDNVRLVFGEGAVLKALPNEIAGKPSALILADDVENVQISGPGMIVGEWDTHILGGNLVLRATVVPDSRGDLRGLKVTAGEPKAWGAVAIEAGEGGEDLFTRVLHPLKKDSQDEREWVLKALLPDSLKDEEIEIVLLPPGQAMGVMLRKARNASLSDFSVTNCWGDGVFIRGGVESAGAPDEMSSGIVVSQVKAFRNRRSNLTLCDVREFRVIGGEYYEAGHPVALIAGGHQIVDYGLSGARIGIHVEPDHGIHAEKVAPDAYAPKPRMVHTGEIAGTKVYNNAYDGIHIGYLGSWGIRVHDNECFNNGMVWEVEKDAIGIKIQPAGATPRTGESMAPLVYTGRLPGRIGHTRTISLEIPPSNLLAYLERWFRDSQGSGIHVHRAYPVDVYNNRCTRNDYGIRVGGARELNYFHGVYGPCVSNNVCVENRRQGLLVEQNVSGGMFRGNCCSYNGEEGIRAVALPEDAKDAWDPLGSFPDKGNSAWSISHCLFSENECVGNSWRFPRTFDNMILTGFCYWNVIRDNDLGAPSVGQTHSRHALYITEHCFMTLVLKNDYTGGAIGAPGEPLWEFRDSGSDTKRLLP